MIRLKHIIKEAKGDAISHYVPMLDGISGQLQKLDKTQYKSAINHISDAMDELMSFGVSAGKKTRPLNASKERLIELLGNIINQLSSMDRQKYRKVTDHISKAVTELQGDPKELEQKAKEQFISSVEFQLKRKNNFDEIEDDVYKKIIQKLPQYTDKLYKDHKDDVDDAVDYMIFLFN